MLCYFSRGAVIPKMTKSPATVILTSTAKFTAGVLLSGDQYLDRFILLRAEVGQTRLAVQPAVRRPVHSLAL